MNRCGDEEAEVNQGMRAGRRETEEGTRLWQQQWAALMGRGLKRGKGAYWVANQGKAWLCYRCGSEWHHQHRRGPHDEVLGGHMSVVLGSGPGHRLQSRGSQGSMVPSHQALLEWQRKHKALLIMHSPTSLPATTRHLRQTLFK